MSPAVLVLTLWPVMAAPLVDAIIGGGHPSAVVALAARVWLGLFVVWWVGRDVGRSRPMPWFEYPAFLFLAWPVLLPHYFIASRGRRGIVLTGVLYAPAAIILILYV